MPLCLSQLYTLMQQALQKARDFFLNEPVGKGGRLGFRTNVLFKNDSRLDIPVEFRIKYGQPGQLHECIVTRGVDPRQQGHFAIPVNRDKPTHYLLNPDNGLIIAGRIKFLVGTEWIDPVDLDNGECPLTLVQVVNRQNTNNSTISPVSDCTPFGYELPQWDYIIPSDMPHRHQPPVYPLEDWQFECPAMVFVYLPNKRTDIYDCVKMLSDLEFGISSQCIVQSTVQKQQNLDQ